MPSDGDVLTWNSALANNQEYAEPTGGGAAEDIAFTPAGTIAATDVQAAIEEVAAEAGGGGGITEVAFAEVTTATITISATTEAGADTVITASAFTADGSSAYLIEFYTPIIALSSGGQALNICLYQDGSSIGRIGAIDPTSGAGNYLFGYAARRMIPASGSRTYSIRMFVESGGSVVLNSGSGGSGNIAPTFIRVTKVT